MTAQQDTLNPAANPAHLPHLVRLLDDESPLVRDAIAREFSAFGRELDALLDEVDPFPSEKDRDGIHTLLRQFRQDELRAHWQEWYEVAGDMEQLEAAYGLIADFMNGSGAAQEMKAQLDRLAADFTKHHPEFSDGGLAVVPEGADAGHAAVALADFLFKHTGLRGAIDEYHAPENSDLLHCLRNHRGLPISLTAIYMLTGHRLGLQIAGCNWPGHFLARVSLGGSYVVVDCFREGACVPEEAFLKMQGPSQSAAQSVLDQAADAETIVLRVINNLAHAYQTADNEESRALMIDLRHNLERHLAQLLED